jgi:hypothetical protein
MATVKCAWCNNDKIEEENARMVTFFGRTFTLCEEDFQLFWKGLGGISALCTHLKTAWAAKR